MGIAIRVKTPKKTTVETKTETTFLMTVEQGVKAVKETTKKRNENNRDNLTQAMKAGRALTEIKKQVPYGQWTKWLQDNALEMGYGLVSNEAPERAAQYDMALWRGMELHQSRLVEMGLIDPLDSEDSDVIDSLDNDSVVIAIGAFYELTRRNAPDDAIQLALDRIASGKYEPNEFTRGEAKKLVAFTKAVAGLPEKHKGTAKILQSKGLDNPQIVSMLPKLAEEHPDLVEEMVASGTISVPHKEEQLPIDSISVTDIELATGYADTQEAFGYIERNKPLTTEIKESRKRNFKQGGVYEGTAAQVEKLLQDALKKKKGRLIRVVWYEQEDEEESAKN